MFFLIHKHSKGPEDVLQTESDSEFFFIVFRMILRMLMNVLIMFDYYNCTNSTKLLHKLRMYTQLAFIHVEANVINM